MRTQLNRKGRVSLPITLTAILAVAITFTLSCSGSDDPDNGGNPGGGGGSICLPKDSQLYNLNFLDGDYHIGTPYTGSGIIEVALSSGHPSIGWNGLNAGSVTSGVVKLELPTTIPNEYLMNFPKERDKEYWKKSCTDYTEGIEILMKSFVLTNSNKDYLGYLDIFRDILNDKQTSERIEYWYFSKDGKFTCNLEDINPDNGYKTNDILSINAKKGWNTIYKITSENGETNNEISTKNILTKELKWTLQSRD